MSARRRLAIALVAGAMLRVLALPIAGTSDVDAWKTWSYHATVEGVTRLYGVGGTPPERPLFRFRGAEPVPTDYPPLALYELGALGHIYSAATHGRFTDGLPLLVAIKLFILVFDVAIAIALFVAVRRTPVALAVEKAWATVAAYAINPAVIASGAVLAYVDVIFVLPVLGAIVTASEGRPFAAGALLAAAVLTKPQAIFIAPAVALALWTTRGETTGRTVVWAIAGGAGVAIVVVGPIAAAGATANMVDALAVYVDRRILSMQCFNFWWIVGYVFDVARAMKLFGATWWQALTVPVREISIPSIVARGLPDLSPLAFALPLTVMAWGLWTTRRARDLFLIAALGAFVIQAYTVLSTDAHENHGFAAVPLLLLAAAGRPRFSGVGAAVTAIVTLNLFFYGFRFTEGGRYMALPRTMTGFDATLAVAALNCATLAWFAVVLKREAALADSPAAPRSSPARC